MNKTEQDYWVEMSIGEILTQAKFAKIAYMNIDPKAEEGVDSVFSSIHSFLSHCASMSKLLKAKNGETESSQSIGAVLKIDDISMIHDREFRNNLEHYDERIRRWIRKFALGANVGTYNIGPKKSFQVSNMIFVSHFDPTTGLFTFIDKDLLLSDLFKESQRIMGIADRWMQSVQFGKIVPPFI